MRRKIKPKPASSTTPRESGDQSRRRRYNPLIAAISKQVNPGAAGREGPEGSGASDDPPAHDDAGSGGAGQGPPPAHRFVHDPPPPPPPPQTIRVIAKTGALAGLFNAVFAIIVLLVVFGGGLIFGIIGTMAAVSADDPGVYPTVYRDGATTARRIAIIPVESIIDARSAAFVRRAVDYVLEDDSFRAVVLRVDSPGGEVTASDQIWYEVSRLKKARIPVVASFGSMAASGGYYVSCSADHIVAEETTITGSIGVIAQILTVEGLMEKVGVEPITLTASGSPQKDVGNDIFRSWTEVDKAKVQEMIDAAYTTFVKRVANGRRNVITTKPMLDKVVSGEVLTSSQALVDGLVDSIGYLDDAIVEAERRAALGSERVEVVRLEAPLDFFGDLLVQQRPVSAGGSGGGGSVETALRDLDADRIRSIINDLGSPRIMYLMR